MSLKMKYFVLKPKGNDVYAQASRKALRAYADFIVKYDSELADSLYKWARDEMNNAFKGNS